MPINKMNKITKYGIILILFGGILFLLNSNDRREIIIKYFKIIEYYELSQILSSQEYDSAIRFLFNSGGELYDGDVCLTIYTKKNIIIRKIIQSKLNTEICLGWVEKLGYKMNCYDTCKYLDTLIIPVTIYNRIAHFIKLYKEPKREPCLYDGEYCTIEYVSKGFNKKVNLIQLDQNNEMILKAGLLLYLFEYKECKEIDQKWIKDLYFKKYNKKNINQSEIKKKLAELIN